MSQSKREGSRKQTTYQYFQSLQLEWIAADLRVRLYPKKMDKDYWSRVKEGKRRIIDSIADKNSLPTIFTDSEMKADYELQVYRLGTFPNFIYKDEHDRNAKEPLDLLYYYSKGKEVRFERGGEVKVGIIKNYIPSSVNVTLEFKHEVFSLPIAVVTRIL